MKYISKNVLIRLSLQPMAKGAILMKRLMSTILVLCMTVSLAMPVGAVFAAEVPAAGSGFSDSVAVDGPALVCGDDSDPFDAAVEASATDAIVSRKAYSAAAASTDFSKIVPEGKPILVYGNEDLPDKDAFVIVALADGFTAGEQDDYFTKVTQMAQQLVRISPFDEFAGDIKFYAIGVVSNESGIRGEDAHSKEEAYRDQRDNYFQMSLWGNGGIQRALFYSSEGFARIKAILAEFFPDNPDGTHSYDSLTILGNSMAHGGVGVLGGRLTLLNIGEDDAASILAHEMGHAHGSLRDEYYGETGGGRNRSRQSDPKLVPWSRFIGRNGVTVHPLGDGYYVPHPKCLMQVTGVPFCEVCKEYIREDLAACTTSARLFCQPYGDRIHVGKTGKDMREYFIFRQGGTKLVGDEMGDKLTLTYYTSSGAQLPEPPNTPGNYKVRAVFAGDDASGLQPCRQEAAYTVEDRPTLIAESKVYDGTPAYVDYNWHNGTIGTTTVRYTGTVRYGWDITETYDSDIPPVKPGEYTVTGTTQGTLELLNRVSADFSIYRRQVDLEDNNHTAQPWNQPYFDNLKVLFLAEGYTAADQSEFETQAQEWMEYFKTLEPYKETFYYWDYRLENTVSDVSGIGASQKRTYFRLTHDANGKIVTEDDSFGAKAALYLSDTALNNKSHETEQTVCVVLTKGSGITQGARQTIPQAYGTCHILWSPATEEGKTWAAQEILNALTGQPEGYQPADDAASADQRFQFIKTLTYTHANWYAPLLSQAYQTPIRATGKPIDLAESFHLYWKGEPIKNLPVPLTLTYYTQENSGVGVMLSAPPSAPGTYYVKAEFVSPDGSYAVYIPEINENVARAVGFTQYTILGEDGPAQPTYTAPTAKTDLTYTGRAQPLLDAGRTGHGTIRYSSDGQSWSGSIPTAVNAGTYTVYWRLNGDSGHGDIDPTPVSVTIARAENTITGLVCPNIVKGGVPAPTAAAAFGQISYTYTAENGVFGLWSTANTAGRYTVKATVAGTANYAAAQATATFLVDESPEVLAHGSSYDGREHGVGSAIHDQGSSNLCWAYSAVHAAEASILRSGLASGPLSLSPTQAAYARHSRGADPLNNSSGETKATANGWSNEPGDASNVIADFSQWCGPVTNGLPAETNGYQKRAYLMTDAIAINGSRAKSDLAVRQTIKDAIVRYGAVTFGFNYAAGDLPYYNPEGLAGAYPHACAIIGWDDTIPKEKFGPNTPKQNGGWLVRNSYNEHAHLYVSYDAGMNTNYALTFASTEDYDCNYFYDAKAEDFGMASLYKYKNARNVFLAKGAKNGETELLEAVNIGVYGTDLTCKVKIYTGITAPAKPSDPPQGVLAAEQTIHYDTGGFRLMKLNTPVPLVQGEYFAIEVRLDSPDEYAYLMVSERSAATAAPWLANVIQQGGWYDLGRAGNGAAPRIKAFTSLAVEPSDVPADPPHVHSYGAPAWNWTGTSAAETVFTCKAGDDTQRVNAVVTGQVTTQANCTTAQVTTYTARAAFNGTEYRDSKTVTGTALGHAWQTATCTQPKTCTRCHAAEGAALEHSYAYVVDGAEGHHRECSVCKSSTNIGAHVYDNDADLSCNLCGYVRTVIPNPGKKPDLTPETKPTPIPGANPAPTPSDKPNETPESEESSAVTVEQFVDVAPTAWYYGSVKFATSKGLFYGTSETTFSPNNDMTRGMLVTVLYRAEHEPETVGSIFTDVATDRYYAAAIAWASQNNIVYGYGHGLFGPEENITREQLATILWRYAGSPETNGRLDRFNDATEVSGYAETALCWAYERGIVSGKGNSILDPLGNATRAEVAAMLMRYLQDKV